MASRRCSSSSDGTGALPATIEAITAKGRHLYFRQPEQAIGNTVRRLGPGLDTRGDGGYVLAPPSVHPSGTLYAWGRTAGVFADAPGWLFELLAHHANGKAKSLDHWHGTLTNQIPHGQRNATLASISGQALLSQSTPHPGQRSPAALQPAALCAAAETFRGGTDHHIDRRRRAEEDAPQ